VRLCVCVCVRMCTEVGHVKQERRVMAHSLSLGEFSDASMQDLLSRDDCEELRVHFVRPKGRPHDWSGLVSCTPVPCYGCFFGLAEKRQKHTFPAEKICMPKSINHLSRWKKVHRALHSNC